MKQKYLFFIFLILFGVSLFGQDAPSGYTTYYNFRKWAENANPSSDSLNANWDDIDQVLYDLIVFTDSTELKIQNDTLRLALKVIKGNDAFSGTKQHDTVTVSGIDSLDVAVVNVREGIPAANDNLGVYLKADTLIVSRNASGTSGLKYNYIIIKEN